MVFGVEINMYECKFCNSTNRKDIVKICEMMFGFRDQFDYCVCANCGSIQIKEIPSDLEKYYPSNYLSFEVKRNNVLKEWLKIKRFENSYQSTSILGAIANKIWWAPPIGDFLRIADVKIGDAILDVGSGGGGLLFLMHRYGFSNLTGIDPYIAGNKYLKKGLKIFKSSIQDVNERYDFIMFNHSLEHVFNPQNDLLKANTLLKHNKYLLIRLPVMGGFAWRTYGVNWVQLDAPRHVSIPTVTGIRELSALTGFSLDKVIYESWDFQFWGSEQFQQDIPLYDRRSFWNKSKESIFTSQQIKDYKRKAKELNQNNDGDMACFFLRKV